MVIEWGDAIVPGAARRLPRGAARLRRRATTTASSRLPARSAAAGRPARGRCHGRRAVARRGAATVLILGIETATDPGRAAPSAGTRACWPPRTRPAASATPRSLAPAIEFICRQARVELSRDQRRRRRPRARACSPACGSASPPAKAIAQALRVPMIGVPSLDLLAFPVRFSPRLIVAVIDARRGEVFYALYRQVPGGLQRLTEPAGRHARRPGLRAASPAARRCLLVGDGALRYREAFRRPERRRDRRAGARPPVGRVAGAAGPRPGAARGVRAARGSWRRSTCASPTPRSTGRPGRARDGRPAEELDPADLEVVVTPMRRRHLRGVLRIEHQRVPAAVVARPVPERARAAVHPRLPRRPGRRRRWSGYAGADDRRRRRPHHHRRGRPARGTAASIGTRLLLALLRPGRGPRRARPHPRGAHVATRPPRRCTGASASPRPASAATTTSTTARTRMVMWAHDIDDRGGARRARIAASVRVAPCSTAA